MKRICVVVCVFMRAFSAVAGIRESTNAEKLSTNIEARQIAADIRNTLENIDCKNPHSDTVKRICRLHENKSKTLLLWTVSEDIMLKYYDTKLEQMQNMSQEKNRSVKEDSDDDGNGSITKKFWLDRGEQDDNKCQWDFEKRQACDYPDRFEEFSITYSDSNSDLSKEQTSVIVDVWFDTPSENKVNNISIAFNASSWSDSMSSSVSISGTEYKYNEYYAWQNQLSSDIRNGKMVKVPKNKYKQKKGSPFSPIEWEMDNSKEWKSNSIPGHAAFLEVIDASSAWPASSTKYK